jgi:phosphatidylglycerophosphatase A
LKALIRLLASGFFAGYSPIAPGTVGSLWGVVIYILLYRYPLIFALATLILFIIGFSVSGKAEELFEKKDSKKIVIDEIASMCLVYAIIRPGNWLMLVLGFVLFRVFDIIKPPPARKIEGFSGAIAVMLDDIVAAIYTVVVLSGIHVVLRLCNFMAG